MTYVFIADKPVIDTDSTTEDQYLLHKGVFSDERADGRCWFISITNREGNTIRTNNGGVFTKCDYHKGLVI